MKYTFDFVLVSDYQDGVYILRVVSKFPNLTEAIDWGFAEAERIHSSRNYEKKFPGSWIKVEICVH